MPRRFHIETVGCQMNVLDSELVTASLLAAGYEAARNRREADVVLFNTCSVRQMASPSAVGLRARISSVGLRSAKSSINLGMPSSSGP